MVEFEGEAGGGVVAVAVHVSFSFFFFGKLEGYDLRLVEEGLGRNSLM